MATSTTEPNTTAGKKSILFVFTSASKIGPEGDQIETGWWITEAAHPYWLLHEKFNIDFASPKGPNPPLDLGSVSWHKDDFGSNKFLNDEEVKSKLATAKSLDQVTASDYDAIFYVGGHGPMVDLPNDKVNIKLAGEFYDSLKIVSAVCHGPAALVNVKDQSGKFIYAGRKLTGFSNEEEDAVEKTKYVPFKLEDKLAELGTYQRGPAWGAFVVVDGNIITGQNPSSAEGVAEAILKALS